jgi:hypothetical protein
MINRKIPKIEDVKDSVKINSRDDSLNGLDVKK